MVNPIVLLRTLPHQDELEIEAVNKHFNVVESRMDIGYNSLVIGRYSVLPFYKELERDLNFKHCLLINTYKQHQYIANLMEWYQDLEDLTPKSWSRLEDVTIDGPFVLKGATNSRKFQWDTHMFANNKQQAANVQVELQNDSLIGYQDIIIREYVPLKTYFHGLPITKEFRFFVAYGQVLSGGYYWSSHVADLREVPQSNEVPKDFLQTVINRIKNKANFYTIDVAQTLKGDWIVIELNDGQMSGLSENCPDKLYKNLRRAVNDRIY